MKVRKPITLQLPYKGTNYQIINYDNIYNISLQENNIEYTAPTLIPFEDDNNMINIQNEYQENENWCKYFKCI